MLETPFDIDGFNARGCLATHSLGSARWDNHNVRIVFLVDFHENMLTFAQERGRAGRWDGVSSLTDKFCVCGLNLSIRRALLVPPTPYKLAAVIAPREKKCLLFLTLLIKINRKNVSQGNSFFAKFVLLATLWVLV